MTLPRRSLGLLLVLALFGFVLVWLFAADYSRAHLLTEVHLTPQVDESKNEATAGEDNLLEVEGGKTASLDFGDVQPFERRGLKRSADRRRHGRVAKPLPWEWDFEYITNLSFPINPSLPPIGGRSLQNVTSLEDLMAQYAALHARILRGEMPQRFVVFVGDPEFGYGNKIQVLVSTFVFALMSERAILIDWPETRDVEITHRPFAGPRPKVTNLDHRDLFDPPHGLAWDLAPALRARFQDATSKGKAKRFGSFATVGVCGDLFEWERDVEWVSISHWDFFATLLLNNRNHENVNRVLIPFHEQLLYVLANALRLVQPTAEIRSETQTLRDSLFAPYRNEGILGIHLRTTHPDIVVDDSLLVQLIHCGLSSGYKVWYLATESREWRDKFARLLHEHDTMLVSDKVGWHPNMSVIHHPVKLLYLDTDALDRNSIEGTRNALIEMFFLTACDDFMMLWGTTFGRLVSSIGGFKEPITVMKHQRLCVRKLTSEPCIYMWEKIKAAPCYNHGMQLPAMLYSSDALCREF